MVLDLTTADFVAALPFSDKIEDHQIRAAITDAKTFDLLPLLGHETLEKLAALPAFTILPYAGPASLPGLVAGQYVARRERVYQVLISAPTNEPPVQSSTIVLLQPGYPVAPLPELGGQWLFCPLPTLWSVYLKAYWLQAAYVRFLLNHGVNVTKAGLTVPIDRQAGTYDRPGAAQVAQLLADNRITAEARLSRLTRFLKFNGLLYFFDFETGAGSYGTTGRDGYERAPGDAPLSAAERARQPRQGRRHSSAFRGI